MVMRVLGKLVLTLAALALLAGPAMAQFGPPRQGGPTGILMLLQDKNVQKELNLEEEDLAKIPDAVMAALAKTLKPEQLKRLKQLQLQRQGNGAFTDAKVQKALKFTSEQKEQMDTILKDSAKEMRELFQSARGGGDFQEMRKKMTEMNKETTKKIQDVLSADQKKKWKAMIGEPFKFEQRGFGGGGRPRPRREQQ
jgi:hypothetical protein